MQPSPCDVSHPQTPTPKEAPPLPAACSGGAEPVGSLQPASVQEWTGRCVMNKMQPATSLGHVLCQATCWPTLSSRDPLRRRTVPSQATGDIHLREWGDGPKHFHGLQLQEIFAHGQAQAPGPKSLICRNGTQDSHEAAQVNVNGQPGSGSSPCRHKTHT